MRSLFAASRRQPGLSRRKTCRLHTAGSAPIFHYKMVRHFFRCSSQEQIAPRGTVRLRKPGQLLRSIQHVSDQLPILKILARMDGDARECVEAGRGAEEGIVKFWDVNATRVRMETRQDGIVECGIGLRGIAPGQ